jgi:beta-glucoside operon transcriptional antiterminator
MQVVKVLNNNALIARYNDQDVVAIGLGISHRYGKGQDMPAEAAEKIFVASSTQPLDRLSAFLTELPLDNIRIATEICEAAADGLSRKAPEALIIAIADHITFATKRIQQGMPLQNPLKWEIAQLYPRELEIGHKANRLVKERLGIVLPDDEAASIAMHLVNAQFTANGLHQGVRMTETLTQIMDMIDQSFGIQIDRESMSASRFVTHMRYVFVRLDGANQINATPPRLVKSIKEAYPDAFSCAERICFLLEIINGEVGPDECAFVSLHIARLVEDSRGITPGGV